MAHPRSRWQKPARDLLRRSVALLPTDWRHAFYRSLVQCDPAPDARLELKIADTQEELQACFALLHDAYVGAGFMKRDPSGLRVTLYHALPTTTTLCAKWDGQVVGTISMIREGVFGFPMQSAFDIAPLRAREGQIVEISALAVHPSFRRTGGMILFPLMKFMYQYCTQYFDARHLVIAVNPNKIELYEALLMFERLRAAEIDHYDFANGAPAVGAALDLQGAEQRFERVYGGRSERKNLHHYFVGARLPNIRWPDRPLYTTNDPVMTPAMLDHFFNRCTGAFEALDDRKRLLLRTIYDTPAYHRVLPAPREAPSGGAALRRHQRFSLRCPAVMRFASYGVELEVPLEVLEVSQGGFGARSPQAVPEGTVGEVRVQLGAAETARVEACPVRCRVVDGTHYYGFRVDQSDTAWRFGVELLEGGCTHTDLQSRMGQRQRARAHQPERSPQPPPPPACAALGADESLLPLPPAPGFPPASSTPIHAA